MTQCEQVLNYMKEYGSINPAEAFLELGVYRLSGRIKDLRDEGYEIKTEMVGYKNKAGEKKHFATYSLEEKEA